MVPRRPVFERNFGALMIDHDDDRPPLCVLTAMMHDADKMIKHIPTRRLSGPLHVVVGHSPRAEDVSVREILRRQIPDGQLGQHDLRARLRDVVQLLVDDVWGRNIDDVVWGRKLEPVFWSPSRKKIFCGHRSALLFQGSAEASGAVLCPQYTPAQVCSMVARAEAGGRRRGPAESPCRSRI